MIDYLFDTKIFFSFVFGFLAVDCKYFMEIFILQIILTYPE